LNTNSQKLLEKFKNGRNFGETHAEELQLVSF
jgi:hypothetical protein